MIKLSRRDANVIKSAVNLLADYFSADYNDARGSVGALENIIPGNPTTSTRICYVCSVAVFTGR